MTCWQRLTRPLMTNNRLKATKDRLKAITLMKANRRRHRRMTDYWQYLWLTTIKGHLKKTMAYNWQRMFMSAVPDNWRKTTADWRKTTDDWRVKTNVQEADQLKHAGRVVSTMQKKDHLQLWSGSTDCFDYNKKIIDLKHSLKGEYLQIIFFKYYDMSFFFFSIWQPFVFEKLFC